MLKCHFRKGLAGIFLLLAGLSLAGMPIAELVAAELEDVIARVGDEVITFSSLDITINSSGMVGIPIPKPGTPERTEMRLTLLDKRITSELLYLDALAKGLENNPVLQADEAQYADTLLARMYRQRYLIGDIEVSDEEIRSFYEANIKQDTPFTSDLHESIAAVLRKQKYKAKMDTLRERLREGVEVQIYAEQLDPAGDADRKSSEVLAVVDGESLTWGQVQQRLTPAAPEKVAAARRESLEDFIDTRIMLGKARVEDLEQDAGYQRRMKEFRKSALVNLRRAQLEDGMGPSDDEIRDFYRQNAAKIAVPEMRNLQMIVVRTPEEAAAIKQKIESGEITFYQAASEYSIDPNAKKSLGELGWLPKGSGFPDLDRVAFSTSPGEIGGPVESPAGWHLVNVIEVRDGQFQDLDDRDTWKQTRRLLLHDKLNRYVAELRQTTFKVEVYDDVFSRLTQEEVDAQVAAGQQPEDSGGGA